MMRPPGNGSIMKSSYNRYNTNTKSEQFRRFSEEVTQTRTFLLKNTNYLTLGGHHEQEDNLAHDRAV